MDRNGRSTPKVWQMWIYIYILVYTSLLLKNGFKIKAKRFKNDQAPKMNDLPPMGHMYISIVASLGAIVLTHNHFQKGD